MKVAFDQHVPPGMVDVLQGLQQASGHQFSCEFCSARDYEVHGVKSESDAPWLTAFASDGGVVVISGDKHINTRPHERLAYSQAGLILFYPYPKWNNLRFHSKAAFVLNWWPKIEVHARGAAPGSCWMIPKVWELDSDAAVFHDKTPSEGALHGRRKRQS